MALDPLTFIERLAALVPRPRVQQLTYHGVLAPAAEWRDLVVPPQPALSPSPVGQAAADEAGASLQRRRPWPARLEWAELLQRVFAINVIPCPGCGAKRRVIATNSDGPIARRILEHRGFDSDPPRLAPARAPDEPAFAW